MHSVILCGGSGTRLWPLSRKNYPKQFLSLYSDKSLLQETYLLMCKVMPKENILFITNKDNFFNVFNQIRELDKSFSKEQVLTEPASLNTAPAITYAMKHLAETVKIGLDEPVVFLPSDHYIGEPEAYVQIFKQALSQVDGFVGTIGIPPTKPEIGYGYIQKGERMNGYSRVVAFKEKPDLKTAEKYLASGEYVWNSGVYLFTPRTFISELKLHASEIYELMTKSMVDFLANFDKLPSISIDYAISEKSSNVVVFDGNYGWRDIGSFDSVAEMFGDKNCDKYIGIDSKNVFVHGDRLVATVGVENINVVETADSILITKRGRSEDVKQIVEKLKETGRKELEYNLVSHRPWGKYEILVGGKHHQVKRLTVYPEQKLSLQSHFHRAEHWIVVSGVAKVTQGDQEIILTENQSTFISAMTKHRLENPGKINLELIEVQTGDYLEEDDIQRYDDVYDRIKK